MKSPELFLQLDNWHSVMKMKRVCLFSLIKHENHSIKVLTFHPLYTFENTIGYDYYHMWGIYCCILSCQRNLMTSREKRKCKHAFISVSHPILVPYSHRSLSAVLSLHSVSASPSQSGKSSCVTVCAIKWRFE